MNTPNIAELERKGRKKIQEWVSALKPYHLVGKMTWNINVTVEETAWGDQRQRGLEASVLPTNPTLCPLDICGFYLPPPPLGTTPSSHSDQFSFLCELALTPGSMGGHVAQCGHPEHSIFSAPVSGSAMAVGVQSEESRGGARSPRGEKLSFGWSYNLELLRLSLLPQWEGLRMKLNLPKGSRETDASYGYLSTWI